MADGEGVDRRVLVGLGTAAAVAVIASVVTVETASASPVERLAVLRAAAQAGQVEVLLRAPDGSLKRLDPHSPHQGFDKANTEKPKDGG
ncbi:MAG: hypothetical protein AB7V46_10305 [Thermomicrobiales bacterium]